jgi:Flp pilus assembly protein TadG
MALLRIVRGIRMLSAAQGRRRARKAGERGQALVETALAIPLLLLVSVIIFEFGRAYQVAQIVTNAAREGARVAVLQSATPGDVQARVSTYLQNGAIANYSSASIAVNQNTTVAMGAGTASASVVTVTYPFSFMVLNPVVNLVVRGSPLGTPINLTASAEMRNEVQ